jgi:threonine/homoserine/homoserine lactone efflux protein
MFFDWYILFQGFAIGLVVALPIGPLNILCISRTLQGGFKAGAPVLLGTSLADASYAAVAVLGLSVVSDFLINYQFGLRLFGGLVLLWMGMKAFKVEPSAAVDIKIKKLGFIKDIVVVYLITISSPLTIVSFAALFASIGMESFQHNNHGALSLILGVLLGTASWMLLLTLLSVFARQKVSDGLLVQLNRFGGLVLLGFAMALFLSLAING